MVDSQGKRGWSGAGAVAALCVALSVVLGGCAVSPQTMTPEEREQLAQQTRKTLFDNQEAIARPMTLEEATARAIKYQAEHRQRRLEEALGDAQLDVAKFDILPKLALNAGYSTRSNEAFGFGFTPQG